VHRVGQFFGHLTARVAPGELALVHQVLPPSAWTLFDGMPVADRRHGLDVAQRLLDGGVDDQDVLGAALLHDAAKGRRLRLWQRVGGVLLTAVAPGLLRRIASDDPRSVRHGFHLFLHHAALSAEAARQAGCSLRTGHFIAGTATPEDAALAAALRRADEAS